MRQVFLDLFAGVAGDMLVAGLLDAGAPEELLADTLHGLLPGEFRWEVRREQRHHIAARRFLVEAKEGHVHRRLGDVLALLAGASLTARAHTWAQDAFRALAEAEGRCHDLDPGQVELHEVGAVDAVVDVAAACALMDALAPAVIWASPVAVGSGRVACAHGFLPVPAPGTLELLRGMPVTGRDLAGERATPTGVALLAAWKVRFGTRPPAVVVRAGYGAGARDSADVPNLLRVVLEEAQGAGEQLVELRTLVDDQSGEVIGAALEAFHAAGAVDAYAVPALGKKGRPAFEVVLLCDVARQLEFEDLAYRQLGTLGMRVLPVTRSRRPRRQEQRETALGPLTFKLRRDPGGEAGKPEFDPLRRRADELGLTPREARARLQGPPADGSR
ncbi:MAG: nickel pincer cofactor biosynthesis protein LarC [Planctomycetota bacterium]|nr:MAG: nickel pincer cofactor biosynthesis protein LarC [Planctomycetota bacterium]